MRSNQAETNRRGFERVPWDGEARLISLSAEPDGQMQRIHHVLGLDIGEGGVQITTEQLLAVRTRLLVEMSSPEIPEGIQAVGSVAWISPTTSEERWLIGIEFSDVGDSARQGIRSLVHTESLVH